MPGYIVQSSLLFAYRWRDIVGFIPFSRLVENSSCRSISDYDKLAQLAGAAEYTDCIFAEG